MIPGLEALSVVLGEKHVDLYWAAKRGSLTLGDMTLHLVCWSDAWDHVYEYGRLILLIGCLFLNVETVVLITKVDTIGRSQ